MYYIKSIKIPKTIIIKPPNNLVLLRLVRFHSCNFSRTDLSLATNKTAKRGKTNKKLYQIRYDKPLK